MSVPEKVTKRVRIDFKGAKGELKEAIKAEVGEAIVKKTIKHLNSGESPVEDGKYKTLKKDGFRSRLFDEGDLWESIEAKKYRDGVEVGVFDADEVPKAYGHNSGFRGHPTIKSGKYKREFIPKKNQEFKEDIRKEIARIVDKHVSKKEK